MNQLPNFANQNIFEQKTTPEFLVFHNLETPEHGASLGAWPLHVTLLGPVQLQGQDPLSQLRKLVHTIAAELQPFVVQKGPRAMYGPDEDVEVTLIRDESKTLHNIHNRLLLGASGIGFSGFDDRWSGPRFSPHVTDKGERSVSADSLVVDSVSICSKLAGEKQVLETVRLTS